MNDHSPIITVYITNFNYGEYLKKSITSVLNQTFKNIELIIVDDGSTDNSKKILNEYFKNKKIKIIYQKNKGLIKSSNIAIKLASGQFIMRLDADDYLDKNALLILYNEIIKNDEIALVYSDYFLIDKFENLISHERKNSIKHNSLKNNPAHGACSLIRKSSLFEVGLYNEKFDRQDGYDLWIKLSKRYKIKNINLPLFYYRQHDKNLTTNNQKLLKVRSRIFDTYSKNFKIKNCVCIIPVRGKKYDSTCLSLEKFKKKYLLFYTIDKALKSKKITKIIVSTADQKVIDVVKKKYKNKIIFHKRLKKYSLINTNYTKNIINFLKKKKLYKENILFLFLNFGYPFLKSFFLDKAINNLILFKSNKVVSVGTDIEKNYYSQSDQGLRRIGKDYNNTFLNLEKDLIYYESGGIIIYSKEGLSNSLKEIKNNKISNIFIDKYSGIKINTYEDIKIYETIRYVAL
jgi:glycosyltransferase involved in cell wall biosynthesis